MQVEFYEVRTAGRRHRRRETAHCRRVAQLVGALDTVEVRSSSLLVPTISFNGLAILTPFFVAPKRSISGLSSCFFKAIP
jgi:hypothetical protein